MEIRFRASERASLGVEVELAIVDLETGELASASSEILAELGAPHPGGEHPKAKHELFECTVEAITGVCTTVPEARADLAKTIEELTRAARARGLALIGSGTHPYSSWHDQRVSPAPRYAQLLEAIQWPARRLAIHGVHYHVGVRSAEKAIAIANDVTYFLPHFLALSASSPYWRGYDTGMASCRIKVFEGLPTAGLPPHLTSWSEFEAFMDTLLTAEAISTIREVWWDVRPHPDFGTVELRMCDAMPTLRETVALAALAQSLVEWLDREFDAGRLPPPPRDWVVRQNKWLAARHGLDAPLIIDQSGTKRPLRDAVVEMVELLAPVAADLGCAAELDEVRAIVERGPGYVRQRRIVEEGGSLQDVVDAARREIETDEPGT